MHNETLKSMSDYVFNKCKSANLIFCINFSHFIYTVVSSHSHIHYLRHLHAD